jgi:hypothetical protein
MLFQRLIRSLKQRTAGQKASRNREHAMSDDLERRLLAEALPTAYFSDRFTR